MKMKTLVSGLGIGAGLLLSGCQTSQPLQNDTSLGFVASSQAVVNDDYVPAKRVENSGLSLSGTTADMSRVEGWTVISYIVGLDGKPQHPIVVDTSQRGDFVEATLRYLNSLEFTPAMIKSQPVLSASILFMTHEKAFLEINNDGVSAGFRNTYSDADGLLAEQKFAQAKPLLDDLADSYGRNLTEQALSAWLHSKYHARQKNWEAYGQHVRTAAYLKSELPASIAVKAVLNLFEWYKYKHQYADAINALDELTRIENTEFKEETFQALLQPVLTHMEGQSIAQIEQTLAPGQSWLHALSRETISLSYTQGEIELVQLRCDNTLHQFSTATIEQYTLPASYRNCRLLVKGTQGAKLSLTEQGQRRDFGAMLE
jgi:hypothetical protein